MNTEYWISHQRSEFTQCELKRNKTKALTQVCSEARMLVAAKLGLKKTRCFLHSLKDGSAVSASRIVLERILFMTLLKKLNDNSDEIEQEWNFRGKLVQIKILLLENLTPDTLYDLCFMSPTRFFWKIKTTKYLSTFMYE